MKGRRGRPKKSKDELRGNVLRILLTKSERAELNESAKAKGAEVSTWARMVLLERARGG